MKRFWTNLLVPILLLCALGIPAQSQSVANNQSLVPRLVRFSGAAFDINNKPMTGVVSITFSLYQEQQGGSPLWIETQNVQADSNGRYSVQLGSTKPDGLPVELFTSGEAQWLGVQISGQAERARVVLLSVPYALKAADAETIGGLPSSAFVLATASSTVSASTAATSTSTAIPAAGVGSMAAPAGTGTTNFIPIWIDSAGTLGNSVEFQSGTGKTAKVGINTTTPATTLDVKGAGTVRGVFSLPAIANATAGGGKNSQPLALTASSFSSGTNAAVTQNFRWQTEPVGNNTTSPSGSLNLLFGSGSANPLETGLKIASNGQLSFATGQTFPGTGPGTVKSVGLSAPSSDFTVSASPVTSTGTLKIAWTVTPTSVNTANAIVKRDPSGSFTAGTITASSLTAATASLTGSPTTNPTLFVSNTNGVGIVGETLSSTGSAAGIEGLTVGGNSQSYGVLGFANSNTGNPNGVYGQVNSFNGVGVFGQNGESESATGATFGQGVGVWGDGGQVSGTYAVLGTVDDGAAGVFENNSANSYTLFVGNRDSTGLIFSATNAGGVGCNIDGGGNLNCTGSKQAVVPIDGGARKVALSAIESPQNWFEDFGSAPLMRGSAVVALDLDFIQTVDTTVEYHVFLTPNADCKGLYISNRTRDSFEVHELGGGSSSVPFSYRVVALRKNYENVRFADHTNDPDPRKQLFRRNHHAGGHAAATAAKLNP
jgi:hypothetical protein